MHDNCPNQRTLTLWERMASAAVGAICTSLLVTPLDVVKTRLQAQARELGEPHSTASCPKCTHYQLNNGIADIMLPKDTHPSSFECDVRFRSTFDALVKISRNEGISALYNGLPPSLVMSIPSTVLYFATYDHLRGRLTDAGAGQTWSPLLAGSLSRTISATVVAPLELIRTKSQSMKYQAPSMGNMLHTHFRATGFLSLWQGLMPTLLRDIPFSAVYWVSVERFRDYFIDKLVPKDVNLCELSTSSYLYPVISFCAGATAGTIAALVTQPFDVVKTRRQISDYTTDPLLKETSSRRIFNRIWKAEGIYGFYVGTIPRIAKIAPACAIMLASYEAGKAFFITEEMTM